MHRSLISCVSLLSVSLLAASSLSLGGCRSHLALSPPPGASTEEVTRRAFFEEHRALPPERGQMASHVRLFHNRPVFRQRSLTLRNGVTVTSVEDLKPLVHEGSVAAAAIDTAVSARERADILTGAGAGIGVAGVAAGAGLFAVYVSQVPERSRALGPEVIGAMASAGGGLLVGGLLMAWGAGVRADEADSTAEAFQSFDAGLWQKLGLEGDPPPLSEEREK